MASFYADHNVAIRVSAELRRLGHIAVTARDLGLERASDAAQLLVAAQQNAILVTHNAKDFILLQNACQRWSTAWRVGALHAGILVCPQVWTPDRTAQELDRFLAGNPAVENELYLWRPHAGWAVWRP